MSFLCPLPQSLKRLGCSVTQSRKSLKFPVTVAFLASFLVAAYASESDFNNGFEDLDSNGDPVLVGWVVDSEAEPGEVVIVRPEGPGDFPVYNEFDLTPDGQVTPYYGDYMLRIGTPKSNNETQPRGVNTVSQRFAATSGQQITLALWLFSLDHRGDDSITISLKDDDGTSIESSTQFKFRNPGNTVCKPPNCEGVLIDVGKRQDRINTGWQSLKFIIPEEGMYTLTIKLEAGQNESLASWLDHVLP